MTPVFWALACLLGLILIAAVNHDDDHLTPA